MPTRSAPALGMLSRQSYRSVLSAAATGALCAALWFGLDALKGAAGREAAMIVSALFFVVCIALLRLRFPRRRKRQRGLNCW
jgi:hypothetical protein